MKLKDKQKLIFGGAGLLIIYALSKKTNNAPSSNSSGTPFGPETEDDSVLNFLSLLTDGLTSRIGLLLGTSQSDFISKMTPIAEAAYHQYGVHPLITLTQAAHESGWGTSGLTRKANNLYGYTGDAALNQWLASKGMAANTPMNVIRAMDLSTAPFIILETHEENAGGLPKNGYWVRPGDILSVTGSSLTVLRPFRRYDSWASSVSDWVQLLQKPRYADAWAAALAGDVDLFAKKVYEAGYATDSSYTAQLIAMANKIEGIANA